ncbi:MAG: hypothetical protein ACRKGH_09695 [Dehalogenimonas sp.]
MNLFETPVYAWVFLIILILFTYWLNFRQKKGPWEILARYESNRWNKRLPLSVYKRVKWIQTDVGLNGRAGTNGEVNNLYYFKTRGQVYRLIFLDNYGPDCYLERLKRKTRK